MFSRSTLFVWVGIVILSGMFLMGQDSWEAPEETELKGTWVGHEVGYPSSEWTFSYEGNWGVASGVSFPGFPEYYAGTFSLNTDVVPKERDALIT